MKIAYDSEFGKKLKEKRVSMGMSQKEAADKIGVSKSMFSLYENGQRFPSVEKLILISHVFDMPVYEIISEKDCSETYIKSLELALNRSEDDLMDTPDIEDYNVTLTKLDKEGLLYFRKLNKHDKSKAIDYMQYLEDRQRFE